MNEPAERSWWSRNWKWVVPVGCLTPIVICGGGVALFASLIFGIVKQSGAYQDSLAQVRADPRVTAALGEPIEPGWLVTGNVEVNGAAGEANISYGVTGPDGSGTVYVEADKTAGQWTFHVLLVDIDDTGDRIDLLAPP